MVRSEELRQYENLFILNGFSPGVKNKRNAYIPQIGMINEILRLHKC